MIAKAIFVAFATISLMGCGTVTTVASEEENVRKNLSKANSSCTSIPRVFSGVAYDLCMINSKNPASYYKTTISGVPLFLVDLGVSGVLDTVLLPYTISKQMYGPEIYIR